MTEPFAVGDRVTVLPPFDGDALLIALQPHATVAEILSQPRLDRAIYMLELTGTVPPPTTRSGPFPATRLVPGWDDETRRRT